MEFITINNLQIEVLRKRIKNIHLRVYPPDNRIQISAPQQMELDSIRLFAISKLDWIIRKQQELSTYQRQTKREYVSGESHYFKGVRYTLKVIHQHLNPHIEIEGRYIVLYVRAEASVERREEIFKEWYRAELKEVLEHLTSKWEKIFDVKIEKWEIKQMKTQWGSCNHKNRSILFNLELAKKPLPTIEYIVAHETAHIEERLHNQRFTSLLDTHIPAWRELKSCLDEFIV